MKYYGKYSSQKGTSQTYLGKITNIIQIIKYYWKYSSQKGTSQTYLGKIIHIKTKWTTIENIVVKKGTSQTYLGKIINIKENKKMFIKSSRINMTNVWKQNNWRQLTRPSIQQLHNISYKHVMKREAWFKQYT